jgi:glucose 1-dehydrogenase
MELDGKIALVTGSDSGIGRAIALTFAREGADIAVHFHADERGAQQTAHAIQHHGRRAEIFQDDFLQVENAERLVAEVVNRFGRLDILVNNAGMGENAETSLEMTTDSFVRVLNVDLIAPFILAREAAKQMVEQGHGSIVNITSVHEEISQPGGAAYCAAKGGLRMITRTLALELASKRVRINNIGPGMITTPMTTDALFDPSESADALSKIPMGRPGDPQEIANLALFLASDKASYITGSSFFADGGLMQKVGLA